MFRCSVPSPQGEKAPIMDTESTLIDLLNSPKPIASIHTIGVWKHQDEGGRQQVITAYASVSTDYLTTDRYFLNSCDYSAQKPQILWGLVTDSILNTRIHNEHTIIPKQTWANSALRNRQFHCAITPWKFPCAV